MLWRALHGGDTNLADIAAAVIANLSQYLTAGEDSFGVAPLPASRDLLAVSVAEGSRSPYCESFGEDLLEAKPNPSEPSEPTLFRTNLCCSDPREFSIHHNYFKFKGVFYRVERPAFACLPTAA